MTEEAIKEALRDAFANISTSLVGYFPKNEQPYVLKLLQANCFIAGGSIRSMLGGTEVKDIDIYFRGEHLALFFKLYLCGFIGKGNNKVYLNGSAGKMTPNSLTTFNYYNVGKNICPAQLINCQSGEPMNVINGFDFTNCMGYYDPASDELYINPEMKTSIETKQLVFNPSVCAFNTPYTIMARAKKFYDSGYQISVAEHKKMLYKITQSPLKDFLEVPVNKNGY